ncbi:hypothetical protein QN277_028929 [Acacia crassicarpa]|uniref:PGG domain-containing protein n=1 Tax=Acacia crassicarpa TaxID=499986 RepID=A0AAE1J8G5_9FABA|nr:hypothetical protein QN277_028929 [Acacia crassicarpa]
MKREFYNAAMQGSMDAFQGMGQKIESILTPNNNTIIHVHLTNYTNKVSEAFVEVILRMCPALLSKTNKKGETILHIAARFGHHKIVQMLIDCAKDSSEYINGVRAEKILIRATNDMKDTALHEAARYGHPKVVEVLIKEEPDHSYFGRNVDDETPLYIAVERKSWDVVDTILDCSNSPKYNGPKGRTALHAAILHASEEKVLKLLRRNLSAAKEADENGWVPLHLAALCASSSMIGELLRYDTSTAYMRDREGRTALHLAALVGRLFAMKKILEHCPDCYEWVDVKGSNALHYMTEQSGSVFESSIEILQDAALSNMYNQKDNDGNTPLHHLARRATEWKTFDYHPLLKGIARDAPQKDISSYHSRVDSMAFNKYGQTAVDIALDAVPRQRAEENSMLRFLQLIGAELGGRVLDENLRPGEQEKRQEFAVDGGENVYKTYSKGVAATLSVVAILIATVTFTAGFTLPGGLFQDGEHKGSPILKYNAAFIAFIVTDSLSFVLSTSAVFALVMSSIVGKEEDEKVYLSMLVKCAILTMVAMVFMIISFGVAIYAVLDVSKGFGVVTLLIVLSFFFIAIILIWRAYVSIKRSKQSGYHGPHYSPNQGLERIRDIQLLRTI